MSYFPKIVDGRVLIMRDGSAYRLTLTERLLYRLGFLNAEMLEAKRGGHP